MNDMCIDIAKYLHSVGLGVYDESGGEATIFVEYSPAIPVEKIVLTQQGGMGRELKYRGDIRYPLLHIESGNQSRMQLKKKLTAITDVLEQVTIEVPGAIYFLRLQAEPVTWKVSETEYRGSVNFLVTQTILSLSYRG